MSDAVFAFGSNMCSGRLHDYSVTPLSPGAAAVLSGYRLCFNKRSKDGSGKANIERDPTAEVWGVLYHISADHLEALDKGEGAGYSRETEIVRDASGNSTKAWVYVATSPDLGTVLRPYAWYKRFLVEGAKEHGLPPVYILQLESIECVKDSDAKRDQRKRALQCEEAG